MPFLKSKVRLGNSVDLCRRNLSTNQDVRYWHYRYHGARAEERHRRGDPQVQTGLPGLYNESKRFQ